ncbi:unnamed protein product, partial [Nesidiocoris tenuis]
MTQEEWVEKKREERIDEFAPTYQQTAQAPIADLSSKKKKKKKKKKVQVQQNIQTNPSTSYPDFETDFPAEENPMFSRTKNFLKKRKAQDEAGSSAYSPGHWSSSDEEVPPEPRKPKGAEVPPPMDFDYFTAAKNRPKSSSSSTIQQTADAIEAGLQLLRQQYCVLSTHHSTQHRKTQFRLNIGREPTLPPCRRAALPEPEPGGAEPGNPSPSINDIKPPGPAWRKSGPAARHGSASRRRYDFENLRPARMFVRVISCSAILLVRIACSRPQSSAVFPP